MAATSPLVAQARLLIALSLLAALVALAMHRPATRIALVVEQRVQRPLDDVLAFVSDTAARFDAQHTAIEQWARVEPRSAACARAATAASCAPDAPTDAPCACAAFEITERLPWLGVAAPMYIEASRWSAQPFLRLHVVGDMFELDNDMTLIADGAGATVMRETLRFEAALIVSLVSVPVTLRLHTDYLEQYRAALEA